SGRTINVTRDVVNRVSSLSDGPTIATYKYIGPGPRIEQVDYGNGTRYAVIYDADRLPSNGRHSRIIGNTTIDERFYNYDAAHNQTAELITSPVLPENHFYS